MLISAANLKLQETKFLTFDNSLLTRKLSSIESSIRKHTNNKFQNTHVRFLACVEDGVIQGTSSYLSIGDTIEISNGVNNGLYTIESIGETIETIEPLYDAEENLITKIEYPIDVIEGAIDVLDWLLIQKGKEKTGIASEGISRHNVSYVQRNADNTIDGYPSELFNFCENYMKARF